MSLVPIFITRCEQAARRRGVSRVRLSHLLFDDGKVLDRLASGRGSVTLRRFERALDRLAQIEAEFGLGSEYPGSATTVNRVH